MSLVKSKAGFFATMRKKISLFSAGLLASLITCRAFAEGGGKDLLSSGKETVAATFGSDSTIVGWLILFEVIAGIIMYTMTKNVKFLVGFIVVAVVINIGLTVAGY